MARVTRIAVDLGIVSLDFIQPIVSKVWSLAKNSIIKTKAKKVVDNPAVSNIETKIVTFTDFVRKNMKFSRCLLLKKELTYLEGEIVKSTARHWKPRLGVFWSYAKVEMAAPGLINILNGPQGKSLEEKVETTAEEFIRGLEKSKRDRIAAEAKIIADEIKAAATEAAALKHKKDQEEICKREEEEAKKKRIEEVRKKMAEEAKSQEKPKPDEIAKEAGSEKTSERKAKTKPHVKSASTSKVKTEQKRKIKAESKPDEKSRTTAKDPPKK